MALLDDINTLKLKEATLTNNKVSKFAYDDTAYADDTNQGADGTATYNYSRHNNIPTSNPNVMKVNPTVVSKGYRSQFSVIPRMLVNHFFGRISYNLNKTVDTFNSLLVSLYTYIGQPNGLATLDSTGRLPYSQLPLSAVEYKGAWDADTNTPSLASGTGTFGDEYIVSVAGVQNLGEGSISYKIGDRVIYNGTIWQRIPSSAVRTVNSKAPDFNGNVLVTAEDMITPDVYGYDRRDAGKGGTWSSETSGLPAIGASSSVIYAKGIWVCNIGSNDSNEAGMYWSDNGVDWEKSSNSYISNLFYGGGMFLGTAFGGSGFDSIYWSEDGKHWTQGTLPSNPGYAGDNCFCYGNGLWEYSTHNGIYWSEDGKNWTKGYSNQADPTGSYPYINGLAYGNGIFVAGTLSTYSVSRNFLWSEDGKNWSRGSTSFGGLYKVWNIVFAQNIFVAGTSDGLLWSDDGKNWHYGDVGEDIVFTDIKYANGIWVVSGHRYQTSTDYLRWSTDGKNFTNVDNVPASNPNYGNIWIAGANSGYVYFSEDGMNWQKNNATLPFNLGMSAYAKGTWVAGRAGSGSYTTVPLIYSKGSRSNNVKAILDWLLAYVDDLIQQGE